MGERVGRDRDVDEAKQTERTNRIPKPQRQESMVRQRRVVGTPQTELCDTQAVAPNLTPNLVLHGPPSGARPVIDAYVNSQPRELGKADTEDTRPYPDAGERTTENRDRRADENREGGGNERTELRKRGSDGTGWEMKEYRKRRLAVIDILQRM